MKINWKVRIKNPAFWVTVIPALITIIYAVLDVFDIAPAVTEDIATRVFSGICTLVATYGIVIDPTTKGASDSERALGYDVPGGNEEANKEDNTEDEAEVEPDAVG